LDRGLQKAHDPFLFLGVVEISTTLFLWPIAITGEKTTMLLNQFPDKDRYCHLAKKFNVIPVCTQILADTLTPVALLKKFYTDQAPVFLLESVEGGERWGRYSFLGVSAHCHIRVYADRVEIEHQNNLEKVPHAGDPLQVLKALMDTFRPADIPELPRFWGGLVGYLSYEMVGFFESIKGQSKSDKALARFIIPDELIIFDNIRNTLTAVIISFKEDKAPDGQAYESARMRATDLLATADRPLPETIDTPAAPEYRLTPAVEASAFRLQVEQIKKHIRAGDIIQAVVSQEFISDQMPDLWMLYRAQRYINPSPYMYFMHLGETALVGSSPETMVRLENNVAVLRPIAGTRPRGDSEQTDRALASDLMADEKERAEHLMLVDLGRNDLGRVAKTGTVQVTDLMVVERYSHVMHLVSNICCDLRSDCDAWDLLRATFPAGTLTGAPKVKAMEIIAGLEKGPRGPYGGAVGYISFCGNMDLAITIRTACVEEGRLTVRAGAGIVADSDPEKERIETVNKAMALERALQLMQPTSAKETFK
jgi:anthranilate synthase component 1